MSVQTKIDRYRYLLKEVNTEQAMKPDSFLSSIEYPLHFLIMLEDAIQKAPGRVLKPFVLVEGTGLNLRPPGYEF